MAIQFYSTRGEHGGFSNFSRHRVWLDGASWPTSEHYFQAQKFAGTPHALRIRRAKSPGEAARLGRTRELPLRADWEVVKDDVMRRVVLAKFEQHPELAATLLSTGDAPLVEHTARDAYWGDGGDGTGKNVLGRILEETRARLRAAGAGGAARAPC